MTRQDCDQKDLCSIKPDACPGNKDCASFIDYHLKEVGKAIRDALKPYAEVIRLRRLNEAKKNERMFE